MDSRFFGPKIREFSQLVKDVSFDAVHSLHYWRHNLKGNKVEKRYFSGKSDYPPVILIQGFMGTRGVLQPLEKFLRAEGRDVLSIDLGFFNVGDVRESATLLDEKIERLMERFGKHHDFEKIDLVGHSMGGLIGLYYIKKLGGHRVVSRLVSLGTPFNGTWASVLGMLPFGAISRGLWQMLPNSDFLTSLKSHPEEAHRTRLFSISAKYDAICPPKSCRLPGAENLTIPVGHGGLLIDQRVFEIVRDSLSPKHEKNSRIVRLHK